MQERGHRAQSELPLEAKPNVYQHHYDGGDHGNRALLGELGRHFGTNQLDTADFDVVAEGSGDLVHSLGLSGIAARLGFKPDQDIVGSAELLEFSLAQPQPANPLPQIADRDTSLSADLNKRAALEIDPVIQTVDEKYQNRSDAQNAGQQKTETGIPHERQFGIVRNKANSMEHNQFPPSTAEPLWGDMTTASRR